MYNLEQLTLCYLLNYNLHYEIVTIQQVSCLNVNINNVGQFTSIYFNDLY